MNPYLLTPDISFIPQNNVSFHWKQGPSCFFFIPTSLCVTFCNYLLPAFVQLDICQKKKKSLLKWIITWYLRSIASVTKETISVIWESEVSYKTEVEHLSAPECGKCEAVEKMRKNMYWVPSMTQENSSEGKFGKSKADQEKLKVWSSDLALNLDMLLGLKVC